MDAGLSEKNRPHKVVYEDMNDKDDALSRDMHFCNMGLFVWIKWII